MKLKDYINEHYIFEKTYNVKSLTKQLANYYKIPHISDPGEVMQHAGSIDNALSMILKSGDTFTADEAVQDPDTGEVYFEKGFHKSGKDVAIANKKIKQRYRNVIRQAGRDFNKAEVPPLFRNAKDISDFASFYDIEEKSLSDIYDPAEAGTDEHDYDFDISVPVKITRNDKYKMGTEDKANMKRLLTLLKKSHNNIDFAGEMALGGKFYTIDAYLK
jgi:hypothetical protein